jgi:single-stranded-DNA-specific exonuclease
MTVTMAVLNAVAWTVAPPDPDAAVLADALHVPLLVAALLRRRGLATVDAARAFLEPRLEDLADPASIPRMTEAVEIVARALASGRRIAVHGDYDVDGISATAILLRGLRSLGADPLWYLPHRLRDGYGLGVPAVETLAAAGAEVLIAADCGIAAFDAITRARALGLDVVVLDHHTPPEQLPPATIVEPRYGPDVSAAPSAAGLAFLFLWALRTHTSHTPALPADLAALAALGTAADVVPLLGDNRRLLAAGLLQMSTAPAEGLRALIEEAGIQGPVEAWQIGWLLGPRLNAPGRLGDPAPALRLLLTDDPTEGQSLARELSEVNRERQAILDQVLAEAAVQADADLSAPAFVVAGEGWHPGVVGLVAGRLAEQYGRPAVAIALEGGSGRGSARSVAGFNLVDALDECRAHLTGFGGHPMAAGVTIAADAVADFRRRFQEVASGWAAGAAGRSGVDVDAEVTLADMTPELLAHINRLAPFGPGNRQPVLAVKGVRAVARRLVGDGAHLRLGVTDGVSFLEAIGFAMAPWGELLTFTDAAVNLAFTPEQDRFDPARVRLRLRALEVPGVDPEAILADTGLLVDRLFRRAADYIDEGRYEPVEDAGAFYTKIVGVTFEDRQALLAQVKEGDRLRLRREPTNPHDPHAIQVRTDDGRVLGYLKAQLAGRLAPSMDAGARYTVIASRATGGGDRHVGMNIYVERHGEEAYAVPVVRGGVGGGLSGADALERLTIHVNEGRPLRPAITDALASFSAKHRAVLSLSPGRGRAAAIAGGAALAARNGGWGLVVAPHRAYVMRRAEQVMRRVAPLGVRVLAVHGLLGLRARERAAAELRAGEVDVVVASAELVREGDLLAPYYDRIAGVVVEAPAAGWVLPPGLATLPALAVTDSVRARDVARAHAGAAIFHDAAARPPLQVVDRRTAGRDAAVEEALSTGGKGIVYTVERQECTALAARIRERGRRESRVGYLHGGLPARLRQIIAQAFREGRLDVLVATGALDEEALLPDVRHVVVASLPRDRDQFLAVCGSAGGDRSSVSVWLAFDQGDAEAHRRALDERVPDRDVLVKVYKALRAWRGEGAFLWPDDETWTYVSGAVPGLARGAVDAACAILEEAGLAARESAPGRAGGAAWQIQLIPVETRKDLGASLRYREGLREREAFEGFAAWIARAGPAEVARAVLA